MRRIAWMAALLAGACGGRHGTLTVNVVVPAGDDPFASASQVQIKFGAPAAARSFPVTGGHFTADLPLPLGGAGAGAVEITPVDAAGQALGYGRSPVLRLFPADATIGIWVGGLGKFGTSPVAQLSTRLDPAIALLPGLGVLVAGGDGSTSVDLYSIYSHTLVPVAPVPSGRSGAVLVGFERAGQATGGALFFGGDSAELLGLDPSLGEAGMWSTLASQATLRRQRPTVVRLADGSFFVAGGVEPGGAALPTAALIVPPPQVAVAPVAPAMMAARVGHSATVLSLTSGEAVLLFGGNASGPAAELYDTATRTFTARDLGLTPRSGHSATLLADGRLLIAGGGDDTMPALASGAIISVPSLTVETRPNLLPTARSGHTATLVGNDLLLCGGLDSAGQSLASCDVLDGATLAPERMILIAAARHGATALPFDTGNVFLAGGRDAGGATARAIELYTP